MDIYLVDPESEDQWPEVFEIMGEGITLVGSFPMDLRVGYDAELESLLGKTVTVSAHGGDYGAPNYSTARLQSMP
jgi:hypothetical protein